MTDKPAPTLTSLDTDIDRVSGRIRVHRATLIAIASLIAKLRPSTPTELRAMLDRPSADPKVAALPQAMRDAMDEEIELLLRRLDEATAPPK